MLQSMTGFGTKAFTLTGTNEDSSHVSMSLKSLNSRFFEATCKLPQPFSHLETDIVGLLKKKLYRGHIYFTVYMSNPDIFQRSIEPALTTASAYKDTLEKIRGHLALESPITMDHIVRFSNIFTIQEQSADKDSQKILLNAIEELIEQVILSRNQEGAHLIQDISDRLTSVAKEIDAIEKQSKIVLQDQKKKVHAALQEIDDYEAELAQARKNALYLTLDKIDIHEEITRIYSHLKKFELHLHAQEQEKGKRLDFILQELAREINTIAAKCSDATIGAHAIDTKVEIEKMREQIQNVV